MLTRIASHDRINRKRLVFEALADVPIILYGAGSYAVEVMSFLQSRGLSISGCFVDDAFLDSSHKITFPVESYYTLKQRFKRCKVIPAFCDEPGTIRNRLKKIQGDEYEEPFFIDCRFWKEFASLTREHIEAEQDRYQAVYDLLSDERSKATFIAFINAKLLHDASDLTKLWSRNQYFPEDLSIFQPTKEEVFIDGGAFTGDTLSDFLSRCGGQCKKYYAFEADPINAERLTDFLRKNHLEFVEVMPIGLWSSKTRLCFQDGCGTSSHIADAGIAKIEVDTLDHYPIYPTFIKMDIEGAEEEALRGAQETIVQFKPKLAISLYHKMNHLTDIPLLLHTMVPEYRFYLRAHRPYTDELVLYAAVEPGCR